MKNKGVSPVAVFMVVALSICLAEAQGNDNCDHFAFCLKICFLYCGNGRINPSCLLTCEKRCSDVIPPPPPPPQSPPRLEDENIDAQQKFCRNQWALDDNSLDSVMLLKLWKNKFHFVLINVRLFNMQNLLLNISYSFTETI